MTSVLPRSFQAARRAPLVLLFSHEAFTRNLSGYGQAIHALGSGLTAKGVNCHVLTPHINNYYREERRENSGPSYPVEIPGWNAISCSLFHQEYDGVSYLELRRAGFNDYFGFDSYRDGKTNNIIPSADLPARYAGGPLTEAGLVYNYALAKAAVLISQEKNSPTEQVIAHGHDHLTALAIYLAHRSGLPTAFTVHNPAYTSLMPAEAARGLDINPGERPQLDLLGLALAYTDILTTVSPRYAEEMGQRRFTYGPTDLKYGPIICDRRSQRGIIGILNALMPNYLKSLVRQPRAADSPVTILAANRLDPSKGYDHLLKSLPLAVEFAAAAGVMLKVEIVASGDETIKEAITKTRALAAKEAIAYSGYSAEAFNTALRYADLAIQPSRFEPCGLFAMTAQAKGILPIVAATGGLRDIVGPIINYAEGTHEYGLSFDALPDSFWPTVIRTAKKVQDNNPTLNRIREAMMLRAQQEYAPARMAEDYLNQAYIPLLNKRG